MKAGTKTDFDILPLSVAAAVRLGGVEGSRYPRRMVSLSSRPDVVVVGAGAAGIAAGRILADSRMSVLIVEARDRPGGRAHTARIAGHALDLGCEWLHSADRNVLAGLAATQGMGLDKSTPPWRKRQKQVGFDGVAQDDFDAAADAFFSRLEEEGSAGREASAATLLEPGNRWNGLLGAISTYYNGAPLDRVSIVDFHRYTDSEINWRVVGGYGTLIASLAQDLPIRFDCPVSRIDHSGRHIRVETRAGVIETSHVIVTVPTGVIASGAIRFDPPLDDHLQDAASLPLGLADKLYFAFDEAPGFEPDTRLLGAVDRVDAGSYTIRPRGRPMIEGYFGGDYAKRLEAGGIAAFADAARQEIAAALGHDIGRKLKPLVATAWGRDPFALGSYSHALPGCADARARLAQPIDARIMFAGEATSPHFYSTAHGAFEEGARAATLLLAAKAPELASPRG